MRDDDVMDQLLRDTMAAEAPRLSPDFDARIMRRVRPRRLTPTGRLVLAAYVVAALATTVWAMHGLRVDLIAAALAIGVPVAAGAGAYTRRLVTGH